MNSWLSLDELHIGFADQESEFADSGIDIRNENESCSRLKGNLGAGGIGTRLGTVTGSRNSGKDRAPVVTVNKNLTSFQTADDHVLPNKQSRSYLGKLPIISPAKPLGVVEKNSKKERRFEEFSSIDVDHFTVRETASANPGPNRNEAIAQRRNWRIKRRWGQRSSSEMEFCQIAALESDVYTFDNRQKTNLSSSSFCLSPVASSENTFLDLHNFNVHDTELALPSRKKQLHAASTRNIFSPHQLPVNDFPKQEQLRDERSGIQKQKFARGLNEKITKFMEKEISLVKGEEKTSTTKQRQTDFEKSMDNPLRKNDCHSDYREKSREGTKLRSFSLLEKRRAKRFEKSNG